MNVRSTATVSLTLLLASCSTTPLEPRPQALQPLVQVSCPPLVPLVDDAFGAWVLWAQYAGGQYRVCRAACVRE